MPIVVIFDKRLTDDVKKPLTACDASPEGEGIVVFSDGKTPVGTIISDVVAQATGLTGTRELVIMCHGLGGISRAANGTACGVAGGQGLKLGAEDLTQQNVKLVTAWKGLFFRIMILACQAAFTSSPRDPCKAPASGRDFCSSFAAHAGTPVIASSSNQNFTTDAVGVAETITALLQRPVGKCTVNFGDLEGSALVFEPSGTSHALMLKDLAGGELAKYLRGYPFQAPIH
jgi:hypothetical protein